MLEAPADKRQWWYRVDTFGASEHQTRLLPGDGVIHLRVNVDPTRPWVGRASHRIAAVTSATARLAEGGMIEELKMLRRRILSVPGTETQVGQVLNEVKTKQIVGVASGSKLNVSGTQGCAAAVGTRHHPTPHFAARCTAEKRSGGGHSGGGWRA